ncbi:IclR family transcriptional regulator domain-containing protein [Aeromicrobium sp. CF3.5]|uniref:IclR family transcriptional regulator domain-containing protein n=1 Tax=Aeromicrobium sp. CF3.5 TaxID=3373078 RepID=UPI003EE693BE
MTPAPGSSDQFVQSLARGLEIIVAFDDEHAEMTLAQVAQRSGYSRATARRFLHTLVELGYMRTDGKIFALTPQVLRLGTAYLAGLGLPQVAQPHLESLSARLGESTSVAVLDGADIVYVARVATRRIMSVGISVGTRFPAYATSMGRVLLAALDATALETYLSNADLQPLTPRTLHRPADLLAELSRVREQGWALVDQELERGLTSMAAPILDARGEAVAALNVSAASMTAETQIEQAREPMLECARSIAADLSAQRVVG